MCGRFLIKTPAAEAARIFRTKGVPPNFPARYNLAPSQDALVVRYNAQDGDRHLNLLRWGLVPPWSETSKFGGYNTINAPSEKLRAPPPAGARVKRPFNEAFENGQRCIVPADGFYEWQRTDPEKQPYAIVPTDAPFFAFAGLWSGWMNRETGEILRTFAIITGEPNEVVKPIHNRMPVMLDEADWAKWLGEQPASWDELVAMFKPAPAERVRAYPISTRVNNWRNDVPDVFMPLAG